MTHPNTTPPATRPRPPQERAVAAIALPDTDKHPFLSCVRQGPDMERPLSTRFLLVLFSSFVCPFRWSLGAGGFDDGSV